MNRIGLRVAFAAFAVVALVAAAPLADARGDDDPNRSITAAREALAEGSFPWYDSQTDSLQPLTFRDLASRRSSWNLGPLLNAIAWTLLAALLAAILVLLFRFATNRRRGAGGESAAQQDQLVAADRVEALPYLAERPRDDLLGQARRHYEQGNYSEAIIYLFSHQLVELDKYAVIRLAKGKTNRQYLRETARMAALRSPLERTMLAFESVFFGRRTLDRAGFEACWNALPEFDQQLRAATV